MVVFVVAIVAAVAIPTSDLANAKCAVVGSQTDNQSLPGAISAAALGAYGYGTATVWRSPSSLSASDTPFCLVVTSSAGAKYYATDQPGVSAANVAPAGC